MCVALPIWRITAGNTRRYYADGSRIIDHFNCRIRFAFASAVRTGNESA